LGTESDELPAFVAINDPRGLARSGKNNFGSGFLPAAFQGTDFNAKNPPNNLHRPVELSASSDRRTVALLQQLNARHLEKYPGDANLAGRIASYELAGRMQTSVPEVMDLSGEPQHALEAYGIEGGSKLRGQYARNCLLARRLLQRGVRYVNLYCASRASGVDGLLNWDAHKTLKADYERHCPIFDGPTAALLTDLKQTGLLDDTLVLWTTEFGRMPTHQEGTAGRDHNPDGFTCWMMGAGVKGGVSYGATDLFGRRAESDPATVWDFYATVLHLLGFNHKELTFYHNGLDRRLTDVHGHLIRDVFA